MVLPSSQVQSEWKIFIEMMRHHLKYLDFKFHLNRLNRLDTRELHTFVCLGQVITFQINQISEISPGEPPSPLIFMKLHVNVVPCPWPNRTPAKDKNHTQYGF